MSTRLPDGSISRETKVEVVDTATGKLVGTISGLNKSCINSITRNDIKTCEHGIALDAVGRYGFISNGGSHAVLVFDGPPDDNAGPQDEGNRPPHQGGMGPQDFSDPRSHDPSTRIVIPGSCFCIATEHCDEPQLSIFYYKSEVHSPFTIFIKIKETT